MVLAQLPEAPVQHADGIRAILTASCPHADVLCLDLEPTPDSQ